MLPESTDFPTSPLSSSQLKLCSIVDVDEALGLYAQFNPSELSFERSVPWSKHNNPKGNNPMLEFTAGENRTLSVDLFFDAYEEGEGGPGVYAKYIKQLEVLTLVPDGATGKDAHPPLVMFVWDPSFPKFEGVITSLSVKYTMFMPSGKPVRATASVKITEMDPVQFNKSKG
jgi:hypothetical protein